MNSELATSATQHHQRGKYRYPKGGELQGVHVAERLGQPTITPTVRHMKPRTGL